MTIESFPYLDLPNPHLRFIQINTRKYEITAKPPKL